LSSPAQLQFVTTSAAIAELSKYMINSFLAAKVSYVNQFYDIATNAGLDYEELRKVFLVDPRVGSTHTQVTSERGFGGKCFPKDLNGIIAWASPLADVSLLRAIADYNDDIRSAVPKRKPIRRRLRQPLRIVPSMKPAPRPL
jgi:UDP-glucose 6-dehydrogenase